MASATAASNSSAESGGSEEGTPRDRCLRALANQRLGVLAAALRQQAQVVERPRLLGEVAAPGARSPSSPRRSGPARRAPATRSSCASPCSGSRCSTRANASSAPSKSPSWLRAMPSQQLELDGQRLVRPGLRLGALEQREALFDALAIVAGLADLHVGRGDQRGDVARARASAAWRRPRRRARTRPALPRARPLSSSASGSSGASASAWSASASASSNSPSSSACSASSSACSRVSDMARLIPARASGGRSTTKHAFRVIRRCHDAGTRGGPSSAFSSSTTTKRR